MQTEIIIAGFGGQGVLFAGQVLAYAAMDTGKEVTWFPSYGPEMRGGTANCTIIIADEEIGSPVVRNPDAVIVLNLPSLDKFEPRIKSGGLLIANASLIDRDIERDDLQHVFIPANEKAEEIGDKRLTNMILLGALLQGLPVLKMDQVKQALEEHLPDRHKKLLESNFEALNIGAEIAKETLNIAQS